MFFFKWKIKTHFDNDNFVFSSYETVGSKAVAHDFTCNIIRDFARRVAWSFFQVRTSTYDLET